MGKLSNDNNSSFDESSGQNYPPNNGEATISYAHINTSPYLTIHKHWIWAFLTLMAGLVISNWLIFSSLQKAYDKIAYLEKKIDNSTNPKILNVDLKSKINQPSSISTPTTSLDSFKPLEEKTIIEDLALIDIKESVNDQPQVNDWEVFRGETNYNENGFITASSTPIAKNELAFPEYENMSYPALKKEKLVEGKDYLSQPASSKGFIRNYSSSVQLEQIPSLSLYPELPEYQEVSINLTPTNFNEKKINSDYHQIRPVGIELGLYVGNGLAFSNKIQNFRSFSRGIYGNVKFSNRLRLQVNYGVSDRNFSTNKIGNDSGIPEIDTPNDDFEFSEAKVDRKVQSTNVGLQYNLRSREKLQPFVGVGIGLHAVLDNTIDYKFMEINQVQGVTNSIFTTQQYEREKNISSASVKIGFAYWMTKNWYGQFGGHFFNRVGDSNTRLNNFADIRLDIFYSF